MNIKTVVSILFLSLTFGCAIPAERARSRPATDMQVIHAPLQTVLACISTRLKEEKSSSYDVVEEKKSVQLKWGEITFRVYDFEDVAGGTLVTLYARNLEVYEDEAKRVIERCRSKLENTK